jgi:hypothetical protein
VWVVTVAQGHSVDSLRDVAPSPTDLDHPIGTADLRKGQQNGYEDAVSITTLCRAWSSVRNNEKAQDKAKIPRKEYTHPSRVSHVKPSSHPSIRRERTVAGDLLNPSPTQLKSWH